MQALKKFSVVITFAALSLSGSSAWATDENSFDATAELNGFKVVPSILTSREALELTIPFSIPPPTTSGGTIALVQQRNPWRLRTRQPSNELTPFLNVRLYFGQHFADGQPILTLCDNNATDIGKPCEVVESKDDVENSLETFTTFTGNFELSDIQFQKQQIPTIVIGTVTVPGIGVIGSDGRLTNDKSGLKVIRRLIERGLIYVVINSAFTAELVDTDNDPTTAREIIYTPPAPTPPAPDPTDPLPGKANVKDVTTQFGDLFRIVDGELRGTLCLTKDTLCLTKDSSLP